MNIASTKLELAKHLLNTEDVGIINHIKAVFSVQNNNWWETLPDEIKNSVNRALKQSEKGMSVPHQRIKESYSKWLKK